MTRLAILADIHANLPALDAVCADMAAFDVDWVIVAGDLITWGPFPVQVVERTRREGWAVIRGNAEYYLLDHGSPRAPATWNDCGQFPTLDILRRQLSGAPRMTIATWPDTLGLRFPDGPPVRVVHGSPLSPWQGLAREASDDELISLLSTVDESIVIAGHTHQPMDRVVGRWRVLNPGSVGLPLDGRFSASYLLLDAEGDDWRPTFRGVPFDNRALVAEFERQRFADECGIIGELIVEEFRTARVQLGPFLRWRATHCPGAPFSPALLDAFRQVDPLPYTPVGYRLEPVS